MRRRTPRLAALAVAAALAGCSSDAGRRELSGAVRFDGEPVPAGEIYFETDVSKGNNGPQAVADIKDGRYRTRPEFGAVKGPHVVRILIPPGANHDPGDVRAKPPRAGEYVTRVEVEPGKEIDFDLPFPKR